MNNKSNLMGSRRRFLKALGSASVSAAALNSVLASSGLLWSRNIFAQEGVAPKRLVVIHVTNGAYADAWHPSTGSGGNFALPESTSPFESFKDQCVFFDGINGEGGHGAHHQCVTANKSESIDMYTASQIGSDTPFSALHLAVTESNKLARINGKGIPMELNPFKAFERLFPSQGDSSGGGSSLLTRRKAVFAANYQMLGEFSTHLNETQKARMELHLDSIEKMEQRFERAFFSSQDAGEACTNPVWDGLLADQSTIENGEINEEASELRANLHMDLIAQAFRCDLTRVATLSFADAGADVPIPGWGMWHSVIHGYKNAERIPLARRWFSEKIALLMDKLSKTPDTDGNTVLDNTLIYVTSDMGNGNAHTNERTPMMLAGGAGGKLIGGQSIDLGGVSYEPMLDTVASAMGLDIEAPAYPGYGNGEGPFSGVLR